MKTTCVSWKVHIYCRSCGDGPKKGRAEWEIDENRPTLVEWPSRWKLQPDGSIECPGCDAPDVLE